MLLATVRTGCVRGQAPRTFSVTHPRKTGHMDRAIALVDGEQAEAGLRLGFDERASGERAVVMTHHHRGRAPGQTIPFGADADLRGKRERGEDSSPPRPAFTSRRCCCHEERVTR